MGIGIVYDFGVGCAQCSFEDFRIITSVERPSAHDPPEKKLCRALVKARRKFVTLRGVTTIFVLLL